MSFSPKMKTLLLRVTTRTPSIGLGRAPPGTSLHSPAEGRYTSVEASNRRLKLEPPVTSNTCNNYLKGLFIQAHMLLYPFIILVNKTGAAMPQSSSIKSWAEVLYPPFLAIPGHSSEGVTTSSHQLCVCVRVWYWAGPPVMWRWSANVTSYLSLTLSYISEGMMIWHDHCDCLWHQR